MNRLGTVLFGFAAALLLSSCSCSVRHDELRPVRPMDERDRSIWNKSAAACGFVPFYSSRFSYDGSYGDFYLEEGHGSIFFHGLLCVTPWDPLFYPEGFLRSQWKASGDKLRDDFLEETRKRGLRLEYVTTGQ